MRTAAAAALIVLCSALPAAAESYQWTISASSTDPYASTSVYTPGIALLHLWLACSTQGIAAAVFSLEASPGILVFAVTPCCGWLNTENPGPCLLNAVGGCPSGPSRAAEILVYVVAPGRICFVDCPDDGNVSVNCGGQPEVHPNAWIGWSNDGAAPCWGGYCGPISVGPTSWGRIKGVYR